MFHLFHAALKRKLKISLFSTFICASFIAYSQDFIADITTPCNEQEVNFTSLVTDAVAWNWDFGDGTTSTLENPTHSYTYNFGFINDFTVSLTVTKSDNSQEIITKTDYISVLAPRADFNSSPLVGCSTPHVVIFNDNSFLADSWFWDFGDGSTSTLQNPVYSYLFGGNYVVSLTVFDNNTGCGSTTTQLIQVTVPFPSYTSDVQSGQVPLTTNFTDTSLVSGLQSITDWSWDFGDGNTSTAQNPTHTYINSGSYDVNLTITLENGCTDNITMIDYILVGTLGIDQNEVSIFKIYPNPVGKMLYIDKLNKIENISIYSISGQELLTTKVSQSNNSIDVSSLSSGLHFLKFKNQTLKFIKK
ncbi:MAG: PKD domain-containing protein [Winogradskyella sp.]|nr:MAG: PKD domain-containing protein [Winogradskyella sp.]